MWDETKLKGMKIPIGMDNFGNVVFWDLENQSTPHKLVCGATGSGKSVSIKSDIMYALKAGVKDIYVFDPKFEFTYLQKMGITVVSDISEIETQMALLVLEMEERIKKGEERKTLIIFDEFADAVANSRKGNELNNYGTEVIGEYKNGRPKTKRVVVSVDKGLEENLRILLQKGR